jgi:hypothetical protein
VSGKAQNAAYLVKTKTQSLVGFAVQSLPAAWTDWLLHRIERLGSPENLDLTIPSWRTETLISQVVQLSEDEILELLPTSDNDVEQSGERIHLPPLRSWRLQNISLDVDSGLVFSGKRVIQQSGGATRSAKDAAFISGGYLRYLRRDSVEIKDAIAPLGDTWHHYHFLIETLPRALHALQVEPSTIFVTSQEPSSAAREVLNALEIPIKLTQRDTVYSASNLILVDNPIKFAPRTTDLKILKTSIQAAFNIKDNVPQSSIYISRSQSDRSLKDEAVLERALNDHGVQIVHMQSLSVSEQFHAVANALTIVGPHGAGISNLILLPEGGRVIELTSGDRFESCYRNMCAALKHNYRLVHIPGSQESPDGKVNQESIRQILELM